jgi:hypothetical protein
MLSGVACGRGCFSSHTCSGLGGSEGCDTVAEERGSVAAGPCEGRARPWLSFYTVPQE